jgi:hypothetical protein
LDIRVTPLGAGKVVISGVGLVTGLHGVSPKTAIILDCEEVYNNIRKSLEGAFGEYIGYPGFRAAVGGPNQNLLVALVPPFPPAIYEAVTELIIFGVRRIVAVVRGYRIKSGITEGSILLVSASIPLDSVSTKLVPIGLPLTASTRLFSRARESLVATNYGDFSYYIGYALTVDSPRLASLDSRISDYMKLKPVMALDTVSAPLYALQFVYPSVEVLVIEVLQRTLKEMSSAFEESLEKYEREEAESHRILSMIALAALEMLKQ